MPNHVNSCALCVCLLFDFCLFTVIDLSPRVLSAQHIIFRMTVSKPSLLIIEILKVEKKAIVKNRSIEDAHYSEEQQSFYMSTCI